MSRNMILFESEDLPLFSGTAMRVQVEAFDSGASVDTAEEAPRLVDLPAAIYGCQVCRDSGFVRDGVFCTCVTGQEMRKASVLADCRQLSSGTLATLTGKTRYDEIDALQWQFVAWATEHYEHGDKWNTLWNRWWPPYETAKDRERLLPRSE